MLWTADKKLYIQTWTTALTVKKIPAIGCWLYKFLQFLCSLVTGHRVSKTEWSYSGGPTANVWCRWCNMIGEIEISDLNKRFEHARSTIWGATGCDILNGDGNFNKEDK